MNDTATRRYIIFFFLLTFVLSWLCWIPLYRLGILSESMALVIGTFGPTTAALILTGLREGRHGLKRLLQKLFIWRVHLKWYLFSLGAPAAVVTLALWIHRWLGGTVIPANDPRQWYLAIPGFLQILFLSVLGEEIGWRGVALPHLQSQYGPLKASVILGVIWGVWHLPLWWMAGNFHTGIPFSLFVLQSLGLTILLTWQYNHTRGSLLMAHLFHTAFNLTVGIAPILREYTAGSLRPLWIAVGLLCALAGFVAFRITPVDRIKTIASQE